MNRLKELRKKKGLTQGKDGEGNLTETVEGMFRRVSDTIAAADAKYDNTTDTKALKSRTPTRLMNQCRILYRIKDSFHTVFHRQNKAG